jgi:hypothetical protein
LFVANLIACRINACLVAGSPHGLLKRVVSNLSRLRKRQSKLHSPLSLTLWPEQSENFRNCLIDLIKPFGSLFNLRGQVSKGHDFAVLMRESRPNDGGGQVTLRFTLPKTKRSFLRF